MAARMTDDANGPDYDCGVLTVSKVALSFGVPVVTNSAMSLAMPYGMPLAAILSTVIGFFFLTRRCPIRTRLLIAVGYFPMMLAILVFCALAGLTAFRIKV